MIFTILLLMILAICVFTDVRERKIYNKVIFPSLLISFIIHLVLDGVSGVLFSLAGFGAGIGLLLIPYLLGGMGAGDVKLLGLIGAMKGAAFVLTTALYMAILGGVIALGILLFRKGFFNRVKSIFYMICGFRYGIKLPIRIDKEALTTTYPYGVAISGGAILSVIGAGWIL